jgi:hypothetical protein
MGRTDYAAAPGHAIDPYPTVLGGGQFYGGLIEFPCAPVFKASDTLKQTTGCAVMTVWGSKRHCRSPGLGALSDTVCKCRFSRPGSGRIFGCCSPVDRRFPMVQKAQFSLPTDGWEMRP